MACCMLSLLHAGLDGWNGMHHCRYQDLNTSIEGVPGYVATIMIIQQRKSPALVERALTLTCNPNNPKRKQLSLSVPGIQT